MRMFFQTGNFRGFSIERSSEAANEGGGGHTAPGFECHDPEKKDERSARLPSAAKTH